MNTEFTSFATYGGVTSNALPKLTINTSLDGLVRPAAISAYSPLSTSGYTNLNSPIRRRNNYVTAAVDGPYFHETKQDVNVWSADRSKQIYFTVFGKIDKGFFLAGQDWTCYRRNYFQVSGAFNCYIANGNLQPELSNECFLELNGCLYPIAGYRVGVSSKVAGSDKEITLVQHTSKRDKGPRNNPGPRPIQAGGNLLQEQSQPLISANPSFGCPSVVTFERLQFKTATANNGKRRAVQQYYTVETSLYAEITTPTGTSLVKIATSVSAPLVVRGRSPGHYCDSPFGMSSPLANTAVDDIQSAIEFARVSTPSSLRPLAPNTARPDMLSLSDFSFPTKFSLDMNALPLNTAPLSQPNISSPFRDGVRPAIYSATSNLSLPDLSLSDEGSPTSFSEYSKETDQNNTLFGNYLDRPVELTQTMNTSEFFFDGSMWM